MPPNYLDQCWEDLTNKLNSCGNGPVLISDQWKKRFGDWKYCIRAKCKKVIAYRKATGGGPPGCMTMTTLEKRGMAAWGMTELTEIEEVPLEDSEEPKAESKTPSILAAMLQCESPTIATANPQSDTHQKSDQSTPSEMTKSTQTELTTCTDSTDATRATVAIQALGERIDRLVVALEKLPDVDRLTVAIEKLANVVNTLAK
ncbi:uncharacterized protein [Atheta coriaria]|uniref:uncharacterized protein n=1 Tax=Dalotia coriaria TaxID=877792 RepID=UPI0031F41BA7